MVIQILDGGSDIPSRYKPLNFYISKSWIRNETAESSKGDISAQYAGIAWPTK